MFFKQLAIALMCNVASFTYGLQGGWLSPLQPALQSADSPIGGPPLTDEQISWIGSLPSVSNIIFPPVFGYVMDRFGRKNALMLTTLPNIISYALLLFASDVNMIYIARIIGGFCQTGAFIVGPIYVTETVTPEWKNNLGSLTGFFAKAGIILGYILGSYTSYLTLNLTSVSFTFVFLVFLKWLPESPVSKKKPEAGGKILKKIVMDRVERKAFAIYSTVLMFQMLSGYMAVSRYAVDIFDRAGTSFSSHTASIITAVSQVVFSFIGSLTMNKIGRKTTLMLTLLGMGASMTTICLYLFFYEGDALGYLPCVSLVAVIGLYGFGFGTVPSLLPREYFNADIRGTATSFAYAWCGVWEFLVLKLFPTFTNLISLGGSLGIFAVCSFVGAGVLGVFMFETKDLCFDEVQRKFGRGMDVGESLLGDGGVKVVVKPMS